MYVILNYSKKIFCSAPCLHTAPGFSSRAEAHAILVTAFSHPCVKEILPKVHKAGRQIQGHLLEENKPCWQQGVVADIFAVPPSVKAGESMCYP